MNKLMRLQNMVSSILMATVVSSAIVVPNAVAEEGNLNELYIAATNAFESKDYATAIAKYKACLELSPDDESIISDLKQAEEALAAQQKSAGVPAVEGEVSAAPKTEMERIIVRYSGIFKEVESALIDADGLLRTGKAKEAIALLNDVETALPNTPASEPYSDRVAIMRQRAFVVLNGAASPDVSENLSDEVVSRNRKARLMALQHLEKAEDALKRGNTTESFKQLDLAKTLLPNNTSTREDADKIALVRARCFAVLFYNAVEKRSPAEAEAYMNNVKDILGENHKIYVRLNAFLQDWKKTPHSYNPAVLNPAFVQEEESVQKLLLQSKSLYHFGDYQGALKNLDKILIYQPDNVPAKKMAIHIRDIIAKGSPYNREKMKAEMMSYVDGQWRFSGRFNAARGDSGEAEVLDPILVKMQKIVFPVSFKDAPLARAIETLVENSQAYDVNNGKGVDIVLMDEAENITVNLTMNNQPLSRVLDTMLRTINYTYDIKDGIVEVRKDIGSSDLQQDEISISIDVVRKMVPMKQKSASGDSANPWEDGGDAASMDENPQELGIKNYLQRTGIKWDGGRSLAYDESGNKILVNQDQKSIQQIRNTIQRLSRSKTKMVSIEAKFIEVNTTALNQISTNWALTKGEGAAQFVRATTNNRTVADAHGVVVRDTITTMTRPGTEEFTDPTTGAVTPATEDWSMDVQQPPPKLTRQPDYASSVSPTFTGVIGTVGNYDLRIVLNALSLQDGTDLMAAPSLTVLSGQESRIRIVQEIRFPSSYDEMQIQVSNNGNNNNNNNNNNGSGSSSVAITPGTPQFDGEPYDVGIMLTVTPTVDEDNSINLHLEPKIVEFEGFTEYGGRAVAISGGLIVTTPSGFFQPIFNIREVSTDVSVYDGATIIIGGLTREEVRTVNDKVPVLGDLPLIGQAFRSSGKNVTKKHLLIFVTANIMSRGGGAELSSFRGTLPGETYSHPTFMTSSGSVVREVPDSAKGEDSIK